MLKVGELVELKVDEGTAALWFGEVRQDSRCPKDVVCVRAGDATVVLTGVAPNGESTVMEIVVDSKGTATGSFGGYSVTVLELRPYPVSSSPIRRDEYRATVVVTRAE